MTRALSALMTAAFLVSCQTPPPFDYTQCVPPSRDLPPSAFRQSIHHSDFQIDPLVTNGDCYEQFQILVPEAISTIKVAPGTRTTPVTNA